MIPRGQGLQNKKTDPRVHRIERRGSAFIIKESGGILQEMADQLSRGEGEGLILVLMVC